jgi:enterobactin synthetase component D
MIPDDESKVAPEPASVAAARRDVIDPANVPPDVRRFRRLASPDLFAWFGETCAVSLDDAEARADADIETSEATLPPSFGRAVRSRVRAHLAGRHCATTAIARLTGQAGPQIVDIPVGHLGAPQWPEGIVGSITHSVSIAAAVVARSTRWAGLGIDCERLMNDQKADDVVAMILPEAEHVRHVGAGDERMAWGTFVSAAFSAKESVYKCLAPITRTFFDFSAVRLDAVDPARGRMSLRVVERLGPGIDTGLLLEAHFRVDQGHVFTAVGLPAAAAVATAAHLPPRRP